MNAKVINIKKINGIGFTLNEIALYLWEISNFYHKNGDSRERRKVHLRSSEGGR